MWQMILTSFKQRQRRAGFYFALMAFLILPMFFTPQPSAHMAVMKIDSDVFKQADNPSWLPIASLFVFGLAIVFFGLSFIQNASQIDKDNKLWDWIFTNHFSHFRYVLSKGIANAMLLGCLLLATMVGTLIMMLFRFPGQSFNPWMFISPFIAVIPGIILISAFSIFIESLFGKFNPFILSVSILGMFILTYFEDTYPNAWWIILTSITGINYVMQTIAQSVEAVTHIYTSDPRISWFSYVHGSVGDKVSLHILPVQFTGRTLILIAGEIGIALLIIWLGSLVLRYHALGWNSLKLKRKPSKIKNRPAIVNTDYQGVNPNANGMSVSLLILEFKQLILRKSKAYMLVVLIIWISLFTSTSSTQQFFLVPLVSLMLLPILANLGIDSQGFNEWVGTIRKGYLKTKTVQLIASLLFFSIMFFPVMIKAPASALQILLFTFAQVTFAVGAGTFFKNNRFIIALLTVFWLIYLNGEVILLDLGHFNIVLILIYGMITIFGLLLTFFGQKIKF